jgi:hypothetical protein
VQLRELQEGRRNPTGFLQPTQYSVPRLVLGDRPHQSACLYAAFQSREGPNQTLGSIQTVVARHSHPGGQRHSATFLNIPRMAKTPNSGNTKGRHEEIRAHLVKVAGRKYGLFEQPPFRDGRTCQLSLAPKLSEYDHVRGRQLVCHGVGGQVEWQYSIAKQK